MKALQKIIGIFIFMLSSNLAWGSKFISPEPIIQSRDCILEIVAERMNVKLDQSKTKPSIHPESVTSLKDFQDSIEEFWHMRPERITNVYQPFRNQIFIINERAYYETHKRSVYDSMAHELVHYVQHIYKGADFTQDDESLEFQAIDIQSWFRDTFQNQFQKDQFICPL